MPVRGGENLKRIIRNAGKGGVRSVQVGFFRSAKYQDGTPVTNVAAQHEFGVGVPERPFMRRATKPMAEGIHRILVQGINPQRMVVTPRLAELVGIEMEQNIKLSIVQLKTPPNSPATIKRKGSANPLVDTGLLKRSVSHKVNR